jgi:hypothetical protein
MKRSRTSESETVFIFIKRPEQLHVRIMTILPTQIEDSYRIRCFLYKDSASKAELKSRLMTLLAPASVFAIFAESISVSFFGGGEGIRRGLKPGLLRVCNDQGSRFINT